MYFQTFQCVWPALCSVGFFKIMRVKGSAAECVSGSVKRLPLKALLLLLAALSVLGTAVLCGLTLMPVFDT